MQIAPVYAAVYVASMLFPALATIFKEKIFNDAKQKLGGKQLDIFVVGIEPHLDKCPVHACMPFLACSPLFLSSAFCLITFCQTHTNAWHNVLRRNRCSEQMENRRTRTCMLLGLTASLELTYSQSCLVA